MQPPVYNAGDVVQSATSPTSFAVVVHGHREALSDRCPYTGRLQSYVSTPASIARYGYVLLVKWGALAFEDDLMDGKERSHAIHVKNLRPAAPEVSALVGQMSNARMRWMRIAARGPATAHFDSHHAPMAECAALGWMERTSAKGWGTFALTPLGRTILATFEAALPPRE